MKNYLLLIITAITVLSGCSKPYVEQYNNPREPKIEEASTSILVEFGTFLQTDTSKLMSATIYNNTGAALAGPANLSTSDFSFIAGFNCPNGTANKSSCPTIKLNFNPQGKNPGEYNATLNLGSIRVPLHATVSAPAVVNSASYTVLSSVVTSLDFGRLSGTQSVMKTITVKNTGSATANGIVQISPSNMYTVSYDTCSNKDIVKNGTCILKFSLSATGKDNGFNNATVSYLGSTLALTGEIFGYIPPVPNVFFTEGVNTIASYDFGQFYGTNSKQLTVNIKNTGTAASAISTATLNNSNFAITYNTCSNISIPVSGSCQVRITFSASGKTEPNYAGILAFGDKNLNLTASFIGTISVSPGASGTIDLQDSGSIVSFSVSGGLPPYQYSVISSTPIGSVFNNNVLSVGLNNTAATTVQEKARIQDSLGQFKEVTYRVKKAPVVENITVTLQVPPYALMFTHNLQGSDANYLECANWGNNTEKTCTLTYPKNKVVNIELQYQSNQVTILNWNTCPQEIPGGPGQFFCNITQMANNSTLSASYSVASDVEVYVGYPQSGRIISSDGKINCGNNNYDCDIMYKSSQTLQLTIQNIASNYLFKGLYNYGNNYDALGTGPSFSFNLNNKGGFVYLYSQMQQDRSGLVDVSAPSSGIIQSSDGNIKCGNGFYQCYYAYDKQAVPTVNFSISGVGSNYIVNNIYNYGDYYDSFGTGPNFSVSTNGYVYIYAEIIEIPTYKLSLKIRGGDTAERLNISIDGGTPDSCEGTCEYLVQHGKNVTISADANGGKAFESWMECPSVQGNNCVFSISSITNVTGKFADAYSLAGNIVSTNSFIPGGSGIGIAPNKVLFPTYSDYQLKSVDLSVDSTVATNLLSTSGTQPSFLNVNGTSVFVNLRNSQTTTDLYRMNTDGSISLIATLNQCLGHYQNEFYSSGSKFTFGCVDTSVVPNLWSLKVIDLSDNSVQTIIANLPMSDYGGITLLDFNFTNNNFIIFKKDVTGNGRGFYKYNNVGTVVGSLLNNPSTSFIAFNMLPAKLANGKIIIPMYNGSSSFWLLEPDLSAINQITSISYGGTQTYAQGNYYYINSNGQPKAIDLTASTSHTNMVLLSPESSFSCGNFGYQLNVDKSFDGLGFCYSTGDGFDIRPNALGTALSVSKIISSTKWAGLPLQVNFNASSYLTSIHSYHHSNDGAIAKQKSSGIIAKVNRSNPRLTREMIRIPANMLVDKPGYDTYFAIYYMQKLTDGRIFVQYFQRHYPGEVEVNEYIHSYLVPIP